MNVYAGELLADNWEWYYPDTQMLQDLTTYQNKWYLEFFSAAAVNSGSYDALKNATPRTDLAPRHLALESINALGDNYRCRATMYLTTNTAMSFSANWKTDDEGACFLNGECIGTNASCANSGQKVFNLHKGCNEICIIWHEGTGGDYLQTDGFSTAINNGAIMTSIPAGGYKQTITPEFVTGEQCTTNTIFFNPSLLNPSFESLNDLSKILNFGITTCETNG